MKAPKYPTKPYPPYKPVPPPQMVDENTSVGSCPIDQFTQYTIEELVNLLRTFIGDLDLKDVKLEFEIEKSWDYDDVTTSLTCNLFTQRQIPNPRLEEQTKYYHQAMAKYKKEYAEYKDALAQYHIDLPIYELEMDKYALEQSKLQVKRLEKKLKVKQ